MQFDVDGEIVAPVKWYWASPGAKLFPGANSFSSDNWITPSNSTLGLGEVWTSPRPWRNGSLTVVPPGDGHICGGDISWFTDGCPSDAPPIPRVPDGLAACCIAGGLLLGGSYKLRFGGGLLLGGGYVPPPLCQEFWGIFPAQSHVSDPARFWIPGFCEWYSHSGHLVRFHTALQPCQYHCAAWHRHMFRQSASRGDDS
jgi:hypothetical protein